MTQKIRILPETLCNQIAAGEVVERPASVIKELLENALDAEATEIRVEVEQGGRKLIRVVDDGIGMVQDDAFLSLERHATSKIRSEEDLFRLNTLGFRGEALPSIASVSRLTIRTRTEDDEEGWEIYTEGGTVKRAGAIGLPRGTTIEVRDLFFNTPARRKFLRRDETEVGHIGDVVTKMALSHPEVQFRLVHNGRPLIEVFSQKTLEERVATLLGRPVLQDLVPLQKDGPEGMSLAGLISQPSSHRSGTGSIYTFINGRFIRDRVIQHALMEGYRNLMVKGRYPVVVAFLVMDPATVDVNVHPTKHEVRFRDQRLVHDFISAAVRDALRPSSWLAGGRSLENPEPHGSSTLPAVSRTFSANQALPGEGAFPGKPSAVARQGVQEALQGYARSKAQNSPSPLFSHQPPSRTALLVPREDAETGTKGFFSSLEIIGQYQRSYILCQDGSDLVVIDQHAAHERVGFEQLRQQLRAGGIERQALLFPEVLELNFREAALFEEYRGELGKLGFELEPFGGTSFILKAVPRLLEKVPADRLLRDVAGELASVGKSAMVEESLEEVLILIACHGVIRANQSLSSVEIKALMEALDQVDFSAHCPHGRPVMKRLPLSDIERMFKRT